MRADWNGEHVIATILPKIRSEFREHGERMARSREIRLDVKKRQAKKKKEKKEGSEQASMEENADGISRTTGSCNLTSALPRTQPKAYTPKAKRRSADIPAGTGSVFIRNLVTLPLFFSLLISINSAQQTELSATDVISPFRWER